MSTRIKLPTTLLSRDRAEAILGDIAALKIELRTKQNEMDSQLAAVRAEYEEPLSTLAKQIEEKTVILERWASENPAEFPKGAKSIAMTHGVVGYRTGMHKLKTLAKWTWKKVLEVIEAAGGDELIRTTKEVDKEAIIALAKAGALSTLQLQSFGVEMRQDETFFIEVKIEEQPAREEIAA